MKIFHKNVLCTVNRSLHHSDWCWLWRQKEKQQVIAVIMIHIPFPLFTQKAEANFGTAEQKVIHVKRLN